MRLIKLVELGRIGTVQLGDIAYYKDSSGSGFWVTDTSTDKYSATITTSELLTLIDDYNNRLQSLSTAVKLKMDELDKIKVALNG